MWLSSLCGGRWTRYDGSMLTLAGHDVRAVSVGGFETCIELPSWKLCFDIGRCPPTTHRYPTVLFSHAHTDHMGGIAHHCASRDMLGMPPPRYVVPAESEEAFHDLLRAWRRLNHTEMPCTVVPAAPGDVIKLGPKRCARVFRAIHRVPALGYALCSTRRRLLPELQGCSQDAIRDAAAAGQTVSIDVESVEVAFCGDTLLDVVDREPLVREARLLILEVTFLDERVPVDRARGKGHVHLDEVIAKADLFDNEALLFTHRSQRYSNAEAERILRERLPQSLSERVTLLRNEPPWGVE